MIKAELYRVFNNQVIFLYFLIILVYSLFGNILYAFENIDIIVLYQNFSNEYLMLFMIVSLFYSSNAISDEYSYYIMPFIKKKRVVASKIISLVLLLLIIFLVSFLFSNFITIIIYKKSFCTYKILKLLIIGFLKKLPLLLMINLICLFFSSFFTKASSALIFTYFLYGISIYLNKFIVGNNWKLLKYFPSMIWDIESVVIKDNLLVYIILNVIYIFLIIVLIKVVIKYKKN